MPVATTTSDVPVLSTPPRSVAPSTDRELAVRRPCPRQALMDAEKRGASDQEIRLLEEAAIAASIARVRARLRAGEYVSAVERARYERDCELLRRFPDNRRGVAGEGWFDLTLRRIPRQEFAEKQL